MSTSQRVPTSVANGPILDRSTGRALSALAHGAILFGVLGISLPISLLVSGVIWLYGRRSPGVEFHARQAGCYQCGVLIVNIVLVLLLGLAGGFSVFNVLSGHGDRGLGPVLGAGLILFAIWFVGSICYGVAAALMVLAGREFHYPLITRGQKKSG